MLEWLQKWKYTIKINDILLDSPKGLSGTIYCLHSLLLKLVYTNHLEFLAYNFVIDRQHLN